jgi:tagatose-1,6-bisphosphate aldolase non-catalytic subunit AgaZ/GatZ
MVRLLQGPLAGHHTLLAVCPNSEAVTRAALRAARTADAPLLYAATLNQVDTDGGYTGWTPRQLATFVDDQAERLAVDGPVLLCLDHGGPWKKDVHAIEDWDYAATMAAVKDSLTACIDAGYRLLHLDPTVDRRLPPGTPVPVEDIVARTVELMQHAEAHRAAVGAPPLAYEVGTEEVGGGLQTEQRVATFLDQLATALDAHGLPRPDFVVGDVGTALDTTHFNPVQARRLTVRARRVGALIKGHYTDGVDCPETYPLAGMGGANVGPGFSAVEYDALMDLVRLERRLDTDSGFREALRTAVIASGRWEKWRHPEEHGLAFEELSRARQAWLVKTGSRYVWTHPAVAEARHRLYENVAPYRDADAYVVWRIQQRIMHYVHAFNLVGFNEVLLDHLPQLANGGSGRRRE